MAEMTKQSMKSEAQVVAKESKSPPPPSPVEPVKGNPTTVPVTKGAEADTGGGRGEFTPRSGRIFDNPRIDASLVLRAQGLEQDFQTLYNRFLDLRVEVTSTFPEPTRTTLLNKVNAAISDSRVLLGLSHAGALRAAIADWIRLRDDFFSVGGGQGFRIWWTQRAPDDSALGVYNQTYGGATFAGTSPAAAQTRQAAQSALSGAGGVRLYLEEPANQALPTTSLREMANATVPMMPGLQQDLINIVMIAYCWPAPPDVAPTILSGWLDPIRAFPGRTNTVTAKLASVLPLVDAAIGANTPPTLTTALESLRSPSRDLQVLAQPWAQQLYDWLVVDQNLKDAIDRLIVAMRAYLDTRIRPLHAALQLEIRQTPPYPYLSFSTTWMQCNDIQDPWTQSQADKIYVCWISLGHDGTVGSGANYVGTFKTGDTNDTNTRLATFTLGGGQDSARLYTMFVAIFEKDGGDDLSCKWQKVVDHVKEKVEQRNNGAPQPGTFGGFVDELSGSITAKIKGSFWNWNDDDLIGFDRLSINRVEARNLFTQSDVSRYRTPSTAPWAIQLPPSVLALSDVDLIRFVADSPNIHSNVSTTTEQWIFLRHKTDYKDATKGEGEYTLQVKWEYHG